MRTQKIVDIKEDRYVRQQPATDQQLQKFHLIKSTTVDTGKKGIYMSEPLRFHISLGIPGCIGDVRIHAAGSPSFVWASGGAIFRTMGTKKTDSLGTLLLKEHQRSRKSLSDRLTRRKKLQHLLQFRVQQLDRPNLLSFDLNVTSGGKYYG